MYSAVPNEVVGIDCIGVCLTARSDTGLVEARSQPGVAQRLGIQKVPSDTTVHQRLQLVKHAHFGTLHTTRLLSIEIQSFGGETESRICPYPMFITKAESYLQGTLDGVLQLCLLYRTAQL